MTEDASPSKDGVFVPLSCLFSETRWFESFFALCWETQSNLNDILELGWHHQLGNRTGKSFFAILHALSGRFQTFVLYGVEWISQFIHGYRLNL